MKALENVVITTDQAMNDKMLHIEKIQKAAIEYTAAASAGNCPPPTLPLECGDSTRTARAHNVIDIKPVAVCSDSNVSKVSNSIIEAKRRNQKYNKKLSSNKVIRDSDNSVENVGVSCTEDTSVSESDGLNVSENGETSLSSDIHDFHVVCPDTFDRPDLPEERNDGVAVETIQSSSQLGTI